MSVFWHFDLQMCFAPQWRAIFGQLNFRKLLLVLRLLRLLQVQQKQLGNIFLSVDAKAVFNCFHHAFLDRCSGTGKENQRKNRGLQSKLPFEVVSKQVLAFFKRSYTHQCFQVF